MGGKQKLTVVNVINLLLTDIVVRLSQRAKISRGRHSGGRVSLMLWWKPIREEDGGGWRLRLRWRTDMSSGLRVLARAKIKKYMIPVF